MRCWLKLGLALGLQCLERTHAVKDAPLLITPLDIDETTIAAGIEHSCAIYTPSYDDVGGRVLCWGVNNVGQSDPPAVGMHARPCIREYCLTLALIGGVHPSEHGAAAQLWLAH